MRLKMTPLLFNIVIIAYLISNCENSPMDVVNKGQLQMRISFAEEINKASTIRQSASINRMTAELSDSTGGFIDDTDLTQSGTMWEGEMKVVPARNLTLTVKALEDLALQYAGSSSGFDVQAGRSTRVGIDLSRDAIFNIQLSPPSPASLSFGDSVMLNFDYLTDFEEGVQIYGVPFTDRSETPNWDIPPSLFPVGSGSGTGSFTITSGDTTTVDQIEFVMFTADQSRVLYMHRTSVEYTFSSQ